MKNLFKLFIFVLLGLALVACDTNNTDTKDDSGKDPATDTVETEPTPEAVQLSKPVVTVDETGLATWEAVENAVSYAFKVNDGAEVVTSVRNYRLTEGDSIVVKAKGNGVTFVDSEYSDAVTYSKGTDEPTQGQNPEPDPNPTEPAKFVYVLEYADTYGEEVEFTYDADADTYSITVEDLTGVVGVEFYYDGDTQISSENTTISGVGTDATSAFYQTSDNKTSFLVGNATIDDATFVYSATNNTLTITYNLINVDVTNVLEYQKYANATIEETGEAVVGDGGKYYVTLEAVSFAKFTLEWNGVAITPDNTEITGTFVNQTNATWTYDLYVEGNELVYYVDGKTATYTFVYTPASGTTGASLVISYELPKVEEDGFVVKVAQNVSSADFTESNGVYTVTMVGSGNSYPGICMYFNGEEITSSNVTVSGDYYADWNSLNGTTAKTGAYYEPNGVKGWFSINSCTLVFVYDSVNNTLTITVQ